MENNDLKRISCKRCQYRKIRCTRIHPCQGCISASVKCEFRDHDYKRSPVSREYAKALESRVGTLEGILARLKRTTGSERDAIIDEVVFNDHLQSFEAPLQSPQYTVSETITKASLQETAEGSMIYHGPTSIFLSEVDKPSTPHVSIENQPSSHQDWSVYHNPTVRLCIALFFNWQYLQFMFINREAFLREFELNPIDGQFCSPALVNIICALGALMSSDPDFRALSTGFAAAAEDLVVKQDMGSPCVTSVQALLCCGCYEAGRGNLSKGWLYSGMAFRMGQDLGFQRDPAHLQQQTTFGWPEPCRFHLEWRRRMYWGSFLSDKIFSLFLGRPTFMQEKDADVNMSEPMPLTHSMWSDWLHTHQINFLKPVASDAEETLLFNEQVKIARVIHDTLSSVFAPPQRKCDLKSDTWTLALLQQLNVGLISWYEGLPSEMRWKKWFTNKDNLNPGLAILHTLYHSTRICFNLPFIVSLSSQGLSDRAGSVMANPIAESIQVCKSSAEEIVTILERYQRLHTLINTPLILAQGAIVSTKAILVTSRISDKPVSLMEDTPFLVLDAALAEMSVSWTLANDARARFREAIHYQPVEELELSMDFQNNTYDALGDLLDIPLLMQGTPHQAMPYHYS